jgi:hypothetical protein
LIPVWQEFIDNVVPLPNNKDHDAPNDLTKRYSETVWVTMHLGKDTATECNRICGINPCWQLEYCTSITKRFFPKRYNIAMNTIEYMLSIAKGESDNGYSMYSWEMSHWPRTLAAMGKGNKLIDNMYEQLNCVCAPVDHILYRQNGAKAPYANRLTAREGINAISAQRLGNAAAGLQAGLLQCNGGSTELDPIIQVFPAWDSNYNAEYMLWAKGGFKVTSRFENGEIQFDEYNFKCDIYDVHRVDQVIGYMLDIMTSISTDPIKIGDDLINRNMIKSKFGKIGFQEMQRVVRELNTNPNIRNPKKYAISMLYNS